VVNLLGYTNANELEIGFEFIRVLTDSFLQPTRQKIVKEISVKGNITWTQMNYDLRINPYLIRHHTGVLLKSGIIQKAIPHGFEFTPYGKKLYEIYLASESGWIEKLRELAKYEPDVISKLAQQAKDMVSV
jgi:predicted transcriptional regulator